MLEESELPYRPHSVNILRNEQFDPAFVAISPNHRIPAIVDQAPEAGAEPLALFESGAILQYLADKSGRLLPTSGNARYETLAWLNLQVAAIGPMFGQYGHFLGYAPEKVPYAIERYGNETHALYSLLDQRLASHEYLAGEYSIADVATFPWIRVNWFHQVALEDYPNVERWYRTIEQRPAVQRGCGLFADEEKIGDPDDDARESLFGAAQRGTKVES